MLREGSVVRFGRLGRVGRVLMLSVSLAEGLRLLVQLEGEAAPRLVDAADVSLVEEELDEVLAS